jgi:hypothetical protein
MIAVGTVASGAKVVQGRFASRSSVTVDPRTYPPSWKMV